MRYRRIFIVAVLLLNGISNALFSANEENMKHNNDELRYKVKILSGRDVFDHLIKEIGSSNGLTRKEAEYLFGIRITKNAFKALFDPDDNGSVKSIVELEKYIDRIWETIEKYNEGKDPKQGFKEYCGYDKFFIVESTEPSKQKLLISVYKKLGWYEEEQDEVANFESVKMHLLFQPMFIDLMKVNNDDPEKWKKICDVIFTCLYNDLSFRSSSQTEPNIANYKYESICDIIEKNKTDDEKYNIVTEQMENFLTNGIFSVEDIPASSSEKRILIALLGGIGIVILGLIYLGSLVTSEI